MFGFNPYSPYGMLPETMPQQGVLGQYPQNMRQPAQGQQAGPGWVTVPTVKDIANVSVQPGVKAWIMAQNDAVFAVRSADQMGVTTTEYYRFERYDPDVEARVNRTEEDVSVTAIPTAAGTVSVTLFQDGVAVPGAVASATTTAATNSVNLSLSAMVRVLNGSNVSNLTLVISGAASSVTNVAVVVDKM